MTKYQAVIRKTVLSSRMMEAAAVVPGQAGSLHLTSLPVPSTVEGKQVLVKVRQVGLDGTDREILQAEYGDAPEGEDYLILGHESLGEVIDTGPAVNTLRKGDLVAATVRRPGSSPFDHIGLSDMTTDEHVYERGISRLHGFLVQFYCEDEEYLVKVPQACAEVGVLTEPASIVAKGITQALEIQRRMKIWRPGRGAVTGAGTIGLLAALAMRLRGMEVTVFGLQEPPYLNSRLLDLIGARYYSTRQVSLAEGCQRRGPFDLTFEATGHSGVAFEAMEMVASNGVLILSSVTAGNRTTEVPTDRINLEFVLGNKLMFGTVNANRADFEVAARDLMHGFSEYPDYLKGLITHRIQGLSRIKQAVQHLFENPEAIKVVVEVNSQQPLAATAGQAEV